MLGGSPQVPYAAAPAPITTEEVEAAQKLWAESIASISKVYADGGDYVAAAGEAAGKLCTRLQARTRGHTRGHTSLATDAGC